MQCNAMQLIVARARSMCIHVTVTMVAANPPRATYDTEKISMAMREKPAQLIVATARISARDQGPWGQGPAAHVTVTMVAANPPRYRED